MEDEELDNLEPFEEITLTVPQAGADAVAIKRLSSAEAVENLGLYTRPDGKCDVHMGQMRGRIEQWTKLVKNGNLPTKSVWTNYTHQLWADIRYGLRASSATMADLKNGLGSSDYYLITA